MPTQYNNTHNITTHTRQLQQYTRSTNSNYTKDNLKVATKHTRKSACFIKKTKKQGKKKEINYNKKEINHQKPRKHKRSKN